MWTSTQTKGANRGSKKESQEIRENNYKEGRLEEVCPNCQEGLSSKVLYKEKRQESFLGQHTD